MIIQLDDALAIIGCVFAFILLLTAMKAQKKFGLAIYKKSWSLFMLVAILMIVDSAILFYISFYDVYELIWLPRVFDFAELALLIIGISMLASISVKLWGGGEK